MNFHKSESGQGVVEIVIVLCLVVIVLIAMWAIVGAEVVKVLGAAGLDNVINGINLVVK